MLRLILMVLLICAAKPMSGQPQSEPPRPRLNVNADTNESTQYYDAGIALLERRPAQAADAFYWASKLNPLSADNYYARRVAILMTDTRRLAQYWEGNRGTLKHKEIQHADSLYFYALTLNPFFYQKLDQVLFRAVVSEWAKEASGPRGSTLAAEFEIEGYLNTAPPGFRAWRAYGNGRFPLALELYAMGIKGARKKASLRTERGRLFYQVNAPDSALNELTLALEEMRKRDAKDFVYFYESKALMEQSIGMAHARLGNADKAKEAFGRALEEDLSYFPAHVQLAMMALQAKDTAMAMSEIDLAVQIRGDNAGLRYLAGFIYQSLGKLDEAAEQARKAIELNPVFAASHMLLGEVLDAQQKPAEAIMAYTAFVTRASRFDSRLPQAMRRLAVLQKGVAGP